MNFRTNMVKFVFVQCYSCYTFESLAMKLIGIKESSLINTEIWRGHWCTVATSKVANSFVFADARLYKFHSEKIWSFILVLFLKLNCQFLANFDHKFLFIQFAFKKIPTSLCCLCFLLLYICLVKYFSSLIMYYNHC